MEEQVVERAPALPVKSGLRASRFLEPIDSKARLDDEQPPLSPATAPHDVYLSSEEDASSSADDFSDYDFESDSELSADSPVRKSHEDTARVVSFVFYGKPSIVELPPRSKSAGSVEPHPVQRTSTDPTMAHRRMSVSSTTSISILSTFSRSSTVITSGHKRQKPSFLSIDPYASKPETEEQRRDGDRPPTPKAGSSMLRRTFSLARKRSKPALNKAAAESRDSLPLRSASVDPPEEGSPTQGPKRRGNYQDVMQAARNSTMGTLPVAETEIKASPKGHSRLRSGLSISMGRRKP